MRGPAELTERFRSTGRKLTPQRGAVIDALAGNETHPTAEAVYAEVTRRLPNVSLRTVYQALNELVALGEVRALDLGTGAARFDPNVDPHHHLLCERCGLVRDVYTDVVPTPPAADFTVERADVVFRGTCQTCSST